MNAPLPFSLRAGLFVALVGVPCVTALAGSAGFDGTYRGAVTRTRGDDSICGKASYQTSYTVVNGQFNMVYDNKHHVGVNIEIKPDGSFSGSQQYTVGHQLSLVKVSGRIAGNVLDAQIEGEACARSYHMTKG